MNINLKSNKLITFLIVLILLTGGYFIGSRNIGFRAVNPYSDNNEERDINDGKNNCIIYKSGNILNLSNSERIESDLKKDLLKYSRTFLYTKIDNSVLCAFTFKEGQKDLGNNVYEFTGKYYGASNLIKVKATEINNNFLKVSISEDKGNNLDGKLLLNGTFVDFVDTLPIDTDFYSIRFFQEDGTIIATFYIGYTRDTVEIVEKMINQALGENSIDQSRIKYYVNGLGEYSLRDIKLNMPVFNPRL